MAGSGGFPGLFGQRRGLFFGGILLPAGTETDARERSRIPANDTRASRRRFKTVDAAGLRGVQTTLAQ